MEKKILIVEDEQNIVDILSFNLEREGYDTIEAYDGPTGLKLALEENPDLILLDLMLPGMDGFDVCRQIRRAGHATPILMLTAREEEADKVLGLELGADDYITKPFSMRELLARVKANLRRTAPSAPPAPPVTEQGLYIEESIHQIFRNGQPLELTQREYELLSFFLKNPEQVFSRSDLLEQVWNYDYVGSDARTVDVTVRRLREKIEPDPATPSYILTRRGVGYYYSGHN